MKTQLINAYIQYMDLYSTVEKYAEDNGLSCFDALTVIQLGKKYNEEEAARKVYVEHFKSEKPKDDLFEMFAAISRTNL